MKISREDVRHVARLAELAVDDAELDTLTGQLDRIVEYVAQLEALPSEAAAAPFHPGPAGVRLRPDVVAPVPLAHGPEQIAPEMREGLFVVPRLGAQEES
ncbi:MAG: Asp-tRNA(Asn)/Glu-tRNA(Gln) amidotransferase subunit GatC [Gemmatimonadales bacterium]|nr:Asp-tRNA(Asn)/Glu-tRNA(Gln) amidotransferase subunit GatC [Gemmatimonadales bacterium]